MSRLLRRVPACTIPVRMCPRPERRSVVIRACPPLAAVLLALVFAVPAPGAPPAATPPAELAKKLDEIVDGPDYKRASWGVLFVNAKTGEVVYGRNPDAMLAPASV